MASGIKTVLLLSSGRQFYVTVVANTSSALTYDLINWEFVIITADAAGVAAAPHLLASTGVGR